MTTQRDELIQTIREGWPAHGSINYPARGGFAEVPPVRDGGMTARVIDFAVDTVLASTKPRTVSAGTRESLVDSLLAYKGTPRHRLFEYPHRADDSQRMIREAESVLAAILAVLYEPTA